MCRQAISILIVWLSSTVKTAACSCNLMCNAQSALFGNHARFTAHCQTSTGLKAVASSPVLGVPSASMIENLDLALARTGRQCSVPRGTTIISPALRVTSV